MAGKNDSAKKPAKSRQPGALRPVLLAGGLGLLWFAETPMAGLTDQGPMWSVSAIVGIRLLADFVGGWVVVSLLRLGVAIARYVISRTRAAA
ncbi:MAG: hypothetical protein JO001_13590 [Alphaproteobacteria bacterium]|nr:hypothetical protein [Alphaproteobacteria bacterium]